MGGRIPVGYFKDPEKTAATFRTFDGVRYSVPGDYATVETDGTVRLLGRGSACINTGGEKVYPEEVEAQLREHPGVFDCVVVGVPDERFGERVVALVQRTPGVSVECARWLARDTPITGFGVETVGTDAGAAHSFEPAFPCHSELMGANKWGLTSLRGLDRLPPTGALLIVCPLPIVGGSGSPARVLALVEK